MNTRVSTRTRLSLLPVFVALIFNVVLGPIGPLLLPDSSVRGAVGTNIDQCSNGSPPGPRLACSGSNWQNGNLNGSNSQYREGDSVAFRTEVTELTAGTSYQVDIQYDNTHGGKHAYDYLTSWNRTESGDPCTDRDCSGAPTELFPIPVDPNLATAGVVPAPGDFAVWGGDITNVAYTVLPAGTEGDQLQTTITITFTAGDDSVLFAWGGHIATEVDWGIGNGASNVSGSPYHMRMQGVFTDTDPRESLTGASQQDRSLKADAILLPPFLATQVSASSISLGQSVTDLATLTPRAGRSQTLTGTISFFVCGPMDPAAGCPTGGAAVGAPVLVAGNAATSIAFTPTVAGIYCFRADYTPDAESADQYVAVSHTNSDTECFNTSQPVLTLEKDPDEGEAGNDVNAGDYAQFTITVSNNSSGTATNVDIDDNLPEGPTGLGDTGLVWEIVSETPDAAGNCSFPTTNNLHCDIPSLAPTQSFSVVVRALTGSNDCGQLDNTAFADADNAAQVQNPGEIDVICGDIDVDKTPNADADVSVTAGDFGTFVITTTNDGAGEARDVTLFDDLADLTNAWEIVDNDPAATEWASCTIETADHPDLGDIGQWLSCGPEHIEAGGARTVTIRVLADADDCDVETHVLVVPNTADADSSNDGSDSDDGQFTIVCGDIDVDKTPNADADVSVTAGDFGTFVITTTNDGAGEARDVTLFDDLADLTNAWEIVDNDPAATEWASCTIETADHPDLGDIGQWLSCGPEHIEAGGARTVTIRVLADADDCDVETHVLVVPNTADADSSNDGSDSDDGQFTIVCGDIDVDKTPNADADVSVTAGDFGTFVITTTNDGAGEARDVTLFDDLADLTNAWEIVDNDPAATEWASCTIETADHPDLGDIGQWLSCGPEHIEAGGARTVTIRVLADADDCDVETHVLVVPNTADADSSNDGSDSDDGQFTIVCGDIDVDKTPNADADVSVTAGDFGTFVITTTNDGAGEARDVTLFDDLADLTNAWEIVDNDPAATEWASCTIETADHPDLGDIGQWLSCGPEHIEAGGARTVTIRVLADADDCDVETHVLVVPNTADADSSNDGSDSDDGQFTIVCADVTVTKEASELTVLAPGSLTYTITGTNDGEGEARDVVIRDNLDDDLEITSATFDVEGEGGTGDCTVATVDDDANQVECQVGDLAAGQSVVVTLEVSVPTAACPSVTNQASIEASNESSAAGENNVSDEVVVAVDCPDVSVAKDVSSPIVVVGSAATFTITASGGTEGTSSDVTLTDMVPAGFTWTVGGADIGDCEVGGTALAAGNTVAGGATIDCNFGPLDPNETRSITVSATPTTASCAATITNTATVAADGDSDTSNNSDSASFTVRCPTLVIDKVASTEVITISGPANALVATPSVVTWTLSYTLTNGPVTGAVTSDPIPAGFIFLDAANGGTFANGTVTWNLGTLTSSGSVSFRTTVDPATISRTGPTVNTATIDSNETPPDTGQDSVTVTVVPPPLGGTPTPRPPLPNTATGIGIVGVPVTVPVELLVVFFIGSLGALALANVRASSRRR